LPWQQRLAEQAAWCFGREQAEVGLENDELTRVGENLPTSLRVGQMALSAIGRSSEKMNPGLQGSFDGKDVGSLPIS